MQRLANLKYGINAGLNAEAKEIIRSAIRFEQTSLLRNLEGEVVDDLRMIMCAEGTSFAEFVGESAFNRREDLTVFFLSLADRHGHIVPETLWTEAAMAAELAELERINMLDYASRQRRGARPAGSGALH